MSEIFENYILQGAGLSKDEVERMLAKGIVKKIRKKQFLQQEGEVTHYHCFIVKGLMRAYMMREDGKEHVIRFATSNWWLSDQNSLNTGQPSLFYIDAIEDSEVLLWSKENFDNFLEVMPALKVWSERLLTKSASVSYNRIYTSIGFSAEEKYNDFVRSYPELLLRVPVHMLASYLGVTRETLTRLRKRLGH